jgi:hypothetical protein
MRLKYRRDWAYKCRKFKDLGANERQPQKPEFPFTGATVRKLIRPIEKNEILGKKASTFRGSQTPYSIVVLSNLTNEF